MTPGPLAVERLSGFRDPRDPRRVQYFVARGRTCAAVRRRPELLALAPVACSVREQQLQGAFNARVPRRGSYQEIRADVAGTMRGTGMSDRGIARSIETIAAGGPLPPQLRNQGRTIGGVTMLMFGLEAARNPAMVAMAPMTIQLIARGDMDLARGACRIAGTVRRRRLPYVDGRRDGGDAGTRSRSTGAVAIIGRRRYRTSAARPSAARDRARGAVAGRRDAGRAVACVRESRSGSRLDSEEDSAVLRARLGKGAMARIRLPLKDRSARRHRDARSQSGLAVLAGSRTNQRRARTN